MSAVRTELKGQREPGLTIKPSGARRTTSKELEAIEQLLSKPNLIPRSIEIGDRTYIVVPTLGGRAIFVPTFSPTLKFPEAVAR